jgi:hypothetical protein
MRQFGDRITRPAEVRAVRRQNRQVARDTPPLPSARDIVAHAAFGPRPGAPPRIMKGARYAPVAEGGRLIAGQPLTRREARAATSRIDQESRAVAHRLWQAFGNSFPDRAHEPEVRIVSKAQLDHDFGAVARRIAARNRAARTTYAYVLWADKQKTGRAMENRINITTQMATDLAVNTPQWRAANRYARKSLLHEWAHTRQPRLQQWELEGGADALAQDLAKQAWGNTYDAPGYEGFVDRVRRERGNAWIRRGQFDPQYTWP